MKKLFKIVLVFSTVLFLASCGDQNTTDITAEFVIAEDTLQTDSVTVYLTINDASSEITGNIVVELLDADGQTVSGPTSYASIEDASVLPYTFLNPDSQYTIEVVATVGRSSVTVGTFSFTTLADTDLEIRTVEEFFAMSENRAGDYILMNDLDFSGETFVTPFTSSFTGTFDGQGYTLSNITITESRLYNGVFGYVSSAKITNLNLDMISIGTVDSPIITSSSTKTGILVGYQSSSLSEISNISITNSNIYISTASATYAYVGGIVGEARGTFEDITVDNSYVILEASSYATVRLGGAAGYVYESSELRHLNVDADVNFVLNAINSTSSSRSFNIYVGGLFGDVDPATTTAGIASGLYFEGNVSVDQLDFNPNEGHEGTYSVFVGGLFGVMNRGFNNVYADVSVSLDYPEETVETNVSKYIRVGGISGGLNTYDEPYGVFILGSTIDVTIDNDVNILISEGVAKYTGTLEAFTLQDMIVTLNDYPVVDDTLQIVDSYATIITNDYLLEVLASITE
jgi:hypothetical protein